jgi:hypothetical protein
MANINLNDPDANKGAVEEQKPEEETNTSLAGQNPHRGIESRLEDEMLKGNDTDFPEPGQRAEHSGQIQGQPPRENNANDDTDADPEMKESGEAQSRNQGDEREDKLAS